jgi:hypothetical protein
MRISSINARQIRSFFSNARSMKRWTFFAKPEEIQTAPIPPNIQPPVGHKKLADGNHKQRWRGRVGAERRKRF